MAEKTIRVYDGIRYKDVTYSEIKDTNGNPTGRYTTVKEEIVTDLGTYLDIEENYNRLKSNIEELEGAWPGNYICLFTDNKGNNYLISSYLGVDWEQTTNNVKETWFEWVTSILRQKGWYVNDEYSFITTPNKFIIFPITPADGSEKFQMYLYSMDK